jgi:methylmalonyl-CoA mutase cobalamin-binding domain/chain
MIQSRENETANMISFNPGLRNEVMIKRYENRSRIRILMAKLGDGYEEAVKNLAEAFWHAGYEVIYTNIQRPEAIVASAIQESVHHIGITLLPGANIEDLGRVVGLLKGEGVSHIKVTAGGYLELNKIPEVQKMGVVDFFPRGTSILQLIQWARDNIKPTEK